MPILQQLHSDVIIIEVIPESILPFVFLCCLQKKRSRNGTGGLGSGVWGNGEEQNKENWLKTCLHVICGEREFWEEQKANQLDSTWLIYILFKLKVGFNGKAPRELIRK